MFIISEVLQHKCRAVLLLDPTALNKIVGPYVMVFGKYW